MTEIAQNLNRKISSGYLQKHFADLTYRIKSNIFRVLPRVFILEHKSLSVSLLVSCRPST